MQLILDGATVDERRHGKVASIRLREIRAPRKPPTPLSVASYLGQRYVFREAVRSSATGEIVARDYALKPIESEDRDRFTAVLADVCREAR